MTALIPEGLEPLAVWDAASPDWVDEHWKERVIWSAEHFERGTDTYRVEFCLLDAPFMVIYRYAVNSDGHKHNGPDGEIATEPPVIVPLAELPPAHLLKGSR